MSVMSQLSQQIQELLEQGERADNIAKQLEVPIEWVRLQADDSIPLAMLKAGTVLKRKSK
jgi:hypothetical protein